MQSRLLLILILNHLIGDFVIQSKYLCSLRYQKMKAKNRKIARKQMLLGNLIHCLLHMFSLICLLFIFMSRIDNIQMRQVIIRSSIDLVSHFCIDYAKSYWIYYHPKQEKNLLVFLLDQIMHLGVIAILLRHKLIDLLNAILRSIETGSLVLSPKPVERVLLISILIVFATSFAAVFISIFMESLDEYNDEIYRTSKSNHKYFAIASESAIQIKSLDKQSIEEEVDGEILKGGYMIGILERIFIIIAICNNIPQLIGFMITVKSIARMKKMAKDKFAEYFLIGNLLSLLFAILPGLMICYFI